MLRAATSKAADASPSSKHALYEEFPLIDREVIDYLLEEKGGDISSTKGELRVLVKNNIHDPSKSHKPTANNGTKPTLELRHVRGDLFSSDDDEALAHCISQDVRMGKGIAVEFRRRFGCEAELKAQRATVGELAWLRAGNRLVFYLVTKPKYSDRPTYDSLRSSLIALRKQLYEAGVTKLSIPRLGCGLDGLQWARVEEMLREVFADPPRSLRISVYTLD